MMAPMPSATSDQPPSVRLSVLSPVAAASATSRSIDLVRNSESTTLAPPTGYLQAGTHPGPGDYTRCAPPARRGAIEHCPREAEPACLIRGAASRVLARTARRARADRR